MTFYLGDTSVIHFNSRDRLDKANSTSTNFQISFKLPTGNNYNKVVCMASKIPHSYYQVLDYSSTTGKSNKFDLLINSTPTEITVPVGNYTKHSIAQILTDLLDAVVSGSTVTYPDEVTETQTGKLTFTIPNSGLDTIQLDLSDDKSYYLRELMGVILEPIPGGSGGTNGVPGFTVADPAVLVSPNAIQTRIPSSIFIGTDLIHGTNGTYNLQEIDTTGCEEGFTDLVFKQHDIPANARTLRSSFDKVHSFYLVDDKEEIIDLNGLDWSCTLLFFKHNNASEFQLQQLKLDNIEKINKVKQDIQKKIDKETKKQIETKIIEGNELIPDEEFIPKEEKDKKEKEKKKIIQKKELDLENDSLKK